MKSFSQKKLWSEPDKTRVAAIGGGGLSLSTPVNHCTQRSWVNKTHVFAIYLQIINFSRKPQSDFQFVPRRTTWSSCGICHFSKCPMHFYWILLNWSTRGALAYLSRVYNTARVGKLEPHTWTESSCKGGNSVLPNSDTVTCKGPFILPMPLSSVKGETARVQVCLGHVSAETGALPCLEGLKENWKQTPISHQVLFCYLVLSVHRYQSLPLHTMYLPGHSLRNIILAKSQFITEQMEAPPAFSRYAIAFDYCHWTYFVVAFSSKQVTVCGNDASLSLCNKLWLLCNRLTSGSRWKQSEPWATSRDVGLPSTTITSYS